MSGSIWRPVRDGSERARKAIGNDRDRIVAQHGAANLAKASFFLHKARAVERDHPFDPPAFEAFVSAAIAFVKATRHGMAQDYGGTPEGF